jgi:hypothetical protein
VCPLNVSTFPGYDRVDTLASVPKTAYMTDDSIRVFVGEQHEPVRLMRIGTADRPTISRPAVLLS